MQFRTVDHAAWVSLFGECRQEAFHLEVRDSYAVPHESERLRRFLNGEPPPRDPGTPWQALVRETTGRGVSMSRVRVVTVPHSDYQRWLLSVTHHNVEAGEDIRYIPRHQAGETPQDDWWLMDENRVVYNLVDSHGKPAGLAITTDPGLVEYCSFVKYRLWQTAIPYGEYFNEPENLSEQ
ncbi:DUF6879 family protein [Nocardia mexicana]|uniref:DUF6879 domain-containing protein n=1 Tax=Nocardia mexicana TaxID=279262 RepID=A0A370GXR5_9NOCA|nr:DUF6879 family protein [Nocardia mexicana]RDI48468.1 hypothetical protein DFR68_108301 [Nocardia mexicana]